MSDHLSKLLSADEIASFEQEVIQVAQAGQTEGACGKLQPLRSAQRRQQEAAWALLRIVHRQCLPGKDALDIVSEVAACHRENVYMLGALCDLLDRVRDANDLNAPPPVDPVFYDVVEGLTAFTGKYEGREQEESILRVLAASARLLARQRDQIAENCYRRLVELNSQNSTHHYNQGLFFKTRGRFEEGMKSNQIAASLLSEPDDSCAWNLGICATGAGNGAVALQVWQGMGHNIAMGRFGLPEGAYAHCKVKVAERPLAERTAETDDPGLEETIWLERLSPCHGIIRSVLYRDLGVDYGDVILIDGAPITHHTYGDTSVPVFPHLATLVRRNYQFFAFAGTQDQPGQLRGTSIELDSDSIVYPHSEGVVMLCENCWRDPGLDHAHIERAERHVVTGWIASEGTVDPARLLEQLDQAVTTQGLRHIYAPDLCAAAGFENRAKIERRRFELLMAN